MPVDMENIVEQRLRLHIEPKRSLSDELDMDAYLRFDLSGIVVDHDRYMNTRYQNRLRFSFAHEVGHFVLHQGIYDGLDLSTPEEWKELVLDETDEEYRSFEWQANEFAGRLLVPRKQLVHEIEKIHEVIKKRDMEQYLKDNPWAVLPRVSPKLCRPFGVSEIVIETRVEREELWPPN